MRPARNRVRLVLKPDRRTEILAAIAREWRDRPDLRLRLTDVQARWNLAPDTCEQILDVLVDARVLSLEHDGSYVYARAKDAGAPHALERGRRRNATLCAATA
jgi:hypothetical protein